MSSKRSLDIEGVKYNPELNPLFFYLNKQEFKSLDYRSEYYISMDPGEVLMHVKGITYKIVDGVKLLTEAHSYENNTKEGESLSLIWDK